MNKEEGRLSRVGWMKLLWVPILLVKDLLLCWFVVIPALFIFVVLFMLLVFIVGLPVWLALYWLLIGL